MKLFRRRLKQWAWVFPVLLILLTALPVQAQSKTLHWDRYYTEINVLENGDLLISETQSIVFETGSFTYGYRTIPLDKTDGIENIRVLEGNVEYSKASTQQDHTFTVSEENNEIVVYWYFPPTANESRTFSFIYTVKGGIKMNEKEGDSLFWKAIPADHGFPIRSGRATVYFPEGVDLGDMVAFGTPAEYTIENNKVTFVATGQIPAGQEMEIGVAFGPGLIQAETPAWQKTEESGQVFNLLLGALGVLVLIGGIVAVILLWYTRGRDPEIGPVADMLAEPPSDLPPGVAGTLVDEKADIQDILATLMDLARRGYLEMIESKSTGFLGLGGKSDFDFRRTNQSWDDLLPFEYTVMNKIFGSSHQQRSLDDLRNKFYNALPKIRKQLYQETVKNQFFRTDPDTVRGRYAGAGIGVVVLAAGVGFVAFALLGETVGAVICPFISFGVFGISLAIAGAGMPVKTKIGAQEAAKWKAFKRYLQDVERYTDLEEATDQFDRYLPYAVAFGLERTWINKFAAVPSTPIPVWYYPVWMGSGRRDLRSGPMGAGGSSIGGGGRAPSLDSMSKGMASGLSGMSAGLVSMLNSASSTLVSRPQSSGSGGGGGWSGGGFSGGGGGGGGSAGFG